jgi:hypothetical protein
MRLFESHAGSVWVLFGKPKLVAMVAKRRKVGTN